MKLILLGSGAVRPDLARWGPAQVVQVAGDYLLFDCGRGASMRLVQAEIPLPSITKTFFTHHHFDHNCDFAYLFLTSWLLGRSVPMEVFGPRGTEAFCEALLGRAYRDDIRSRRGHPLYSAEGEKWHARDLTEPQATLHWPGFRIKTAHVTHKTPILDNLAYRIEAEGKALVVVGDTTLCPELMDLAEGADVLVHECSFPSAVLEEEHWDAFHTKPRELGRWARERGVKRLVLKHFCLRPGKVELEPMIAEVRDTFGEEGLVVGEDLLELDV